MYGLDVGHYYWIQKLQHIIHQILYIHLHTTKLSILFENNLQSLFTEFSKETQAWKILF